MTDWFRKAWLFGLGAFSYTKERVEALVQEMIQRGEISQQEGPEAVKQMLAKIQDAQEALVAKIKEVTKDILAEYHPAKARDLEALENRVAALEDELKRLKG